MIKNHRAKFVIIFDKFFINYILKMTLHSQFMRPSARKSWMKICSLYTGNRMDVNFCKENLISGSKIAIMIAALTDAQ